MRNAIRMLLPDLLLAHDGPTSLITNIMAQDAENRWVVHLLHYVPERKCATQDIIDNLYPLYGLSVSMTVPQKAARVKLVPEGADLPFEQLGDKLRFKVPEIVGHRMLAVEFAPN